MKAIGYVRVSTDRQAQLGVSLEAQEAKIRAMATVHGAALLEVVVDGGESAKNLNRPGVQRLLALVDCGKVEAVIIAKLDRLTRSIKASAACWNPREARRRVGLGSGIPRHGLGRRPPGDHHHGSGLAVGARGHRGTDAGRAAAQAHQWGAGREYPVRIPSQPGR
jgi:hypothetical protein